MEFLERKKIAVLSKGLKALVIVSVKLKYIVSYLVMHSSENITQHGQFPIRHIISERIKYCVARICVPRQVRITLDLLCKLLCI